MLLWGKIPTIGSFIHTHTYPQQEALEEHISWREIITSHTATLSVAVCHQPTRPGILHGAWLQLLPGNFVHTSSLILNAATQSSHRWLGTKL